MKSADEGQSKPLFMIIEIGIDCSLDDVAITVHVIGGLLYSTVTFQSHLICNFFPIVNFRFLDSKQGSFYGIDY